MNDLIIIRHALNPTTDGETPVKLVASRDVLAKRRWRGVAEDGREFGFDLVEPLSHGNAFYAEGNTLYILEQQREEVLQIATTTKEQAARIAWELGNLHFPIGIQPEAILAIEDPAVLQFLAREGIAFQRVTCLFLSRSATHHHHDHGHHHG